ncbi:hypothetical protein BIV25_28045 [Streptomyces sp. MUSC 14]|nr:hypothetical protein BIV25_28045 [Streptomyces sp. MUSC 14]
MRIKRVLATVGVVVAAGIAPIVTASSASATVAQCTGIVHTYGYTVGAKVTTACGYGAIHGPFDEKIANPDCLYRLRQLGISDDVSETACSWA